MAIEDRFDFLPGVPVSPLDIPELRFQLLGGTVHTLQVWQSGSTARGSVPLRELQDRVGRTELKDGWYDALGEYLGDDPSLPEPPVDPGLTE